MRTLHRTRRLDEVEEIPHGVLSLCADPCTLGAYRPGGPVHRPFDPHTPWPPHLLERVPKSQHTTQHELLLLLRACRTASLRRSTSTTSTVVSSLSRPNLAGMSVQTSARPGRRGRCGRGSRVGRWSAAPNMSRSRACHDPAHPGAHINTRASTATPTRARDGGRPRAWRPFAPECVCMCRPGGGMYPVSSAARRDVLFSTACGRASRC